MSQTQQLEKVIQQVEKLLEKQKVLVKERDKLKSENQKLKVDLKEKTSAVKTLEKKLASLKLASSLDSQADSKEMKQKINEYVKEIDRCILFLSE